MPLFYAFNWKNELRQLCIKTSWSTSTQNLFLRGPAFVFSWTPWFWSNPSDFQMKLRSECCFIVVSYPRQQKWVRKQKKTWKKCRSNWSLVRLVCSRIGLWSDLCALEIASDQTVPEQSGLWSGKFQTIVQTKVRSKPFPDHVIRAHREHVCAWNSSDQGSLRSGHLDLGWFDLLTINSLLFGGIDEKFRCRDNWETFFMFLGFVVLDGLNCERQV